MDEGQQGRVQKGLVPFHNQVLDISRGGKELPRLTQQNQDEQKPNRLGFCQREV